MSTYYFKVLDDDGHTWTIAGYGNSKWEAYNNAIEKLPPTSQIIEYD